MTMTQTDRLYKITLIEDLNKMKMFLNNDVLTIEEFDDLYEMDIPQLEIAVSINNRIMSIYSPA